MEPREGHFNAMLQVYGYLQRYAKGRILVDDTPMDLSQYTVVDYTTWHQFYPDALEELPQNMPTPKGPSAELVAFVDADHAHNQVTQHSVTGILLFMNGMPIQWVSK
jgi:hypothetical protein